MNIMSKVQVLLSSYNGEKYIREQIDSVLLQEGVDVELLIRDDGSQDKTVAILEEYSRYDERIRFYQGENLGSCYSFLDLVKHAGDADYYAFCDQDDVWDTNKLIIAVDFLNKLDHNKPALYYSNLKVVDENLSFCRNSFTRDRSIKNKYSSLIEFIAVGCTEVFNNSLRNIINCHIPSKCLMHDAWALTICSFFGNTVYDPCPHIMYRQHQKNVVGTKKNELERIFDRILRLSNKELQPRLLHTETFYEQFSLEIDDKDDCMLNKILDYRNSIKSRISLLLERRIHTLSIDAEIRYRALIILGLI